MRTINGKKVQMKDCLPGDLIALTETIEIAGDNYLNVVVKPSLLLANKCLNDEHAFNVISLNDGRPRSFHPSVEIYIFERNDVFQ